MGAPLHGAWRRAVALLLCAEAFAASEAVPGWCTHLDDGQPHRECISQRCGTCRVQITGPQADRNCGIQVGGAPDDSLVADDGFLCFAGCACTQLFANDILRSAKAQAA